MMIFLKPGPAGSTVDADQVLVEPLGDVAEHEVVVRGVVIGVPGFGEAGRALLELVAVAGPLVLVDHVVDHVRLAALGQGLQQIAEADVAGRHRVAALAHVFDERGECPLAVFRLGQLHHQRDRVRALRIGGVGAGVGVAEFGEPGGANFVGQLGVRRGILVLAEQRRDLRTSRGRRR